MGTTLFDSSGEYSGEEGKIVGKIEKQVSAKDYLSASFSCQFLAKKAEEHQDTGSSIRYTELAIKYSLLDQRFHAAGWLYRTLADLYFKKEEYPKSIENAVKSAECFLRENSNYAAQWSYNLAARASELQGEFYAAIRFYKKSLGLGEDEEIEKGVEKLKKKIPHPLVFLSAAKESAEEGEDLEFKISIENTSCEPLKGLKISGIDGNTIQEIGRLGPHEERALAIKATAHIGFRFPCRKISWENTVGDKFDQKIEPVKINVIPKIDILVSCNQPVRLNRPSDFIIIVKNNSSAAIHHIEASAKFPDGAASAAGTKTHSGHIFPGEERGFVFSITPKAVGEFEIRQIKVSYNDDYGMRHEGAAPPFKIKSVVEEAAKGRINAENPLSKEFVQRLKILESRRGKISMAPHPISEEEYIKLTKYYNSAETGYTLDHISLDHLISHILDACEPFTLISSMDFEGEKLFLFSGIEFDRVYLLTVALKREASLINVLFKAYSNIKDGVKEFLENISQTVSYSSMIMNAAKEVEKIEVSQAIKIIDSIIQRSQIGSGEQAKKGRHWSADQCPTESTETDLGQSDKDLFPARFKKETIRDSIVQKTGGL